MVLYRNQWPGNFILHFAKLHIDSSIRYENTLFKNYFINIILSKELKYPSVVFLGIYDLLPTYSFNFMDLLHDFT